MTAKKKSRRRLWSVTRIRDPRHPGFTLRVTEMQKNGPLYFVVRPKGRKPYFRKLVPATTRASLGTNPERKAKALALTYVERLARQPDEEDGADGSDGSQGEPLTLRALIDRYELDGGHGVTKAYARAAVAQARRVTKFLGPDRTVRSIKPYEVARYMAHRNGVRVAGRRDLVALKIAITWAIKQRLMPGPNPLEEARDEMRCPNDPVRPFVTAERYEKLRAVAAQVSPAFGVLLDLAWHTGRRYSAILALKWKDVSFEETDDAPFGSIRWYAGRKADNKAREHTMPMNSAVHDALIEWRKRSGGIGAAPVIPSPRDHSRPHSKSGARVWLLKAEQLAGLEHMEGGGFHAFRRGWCTARKGFSAKDVAVAGDWRDESMVQIYQQAEEARVKAAAVFVA